MSLGGTNLIDDQGFEVPAGSTLSVSGLTGNIGNITLATGGNATVEGTNLTNNVGLTVPTGAELLVGGMIGNLGSISLGESSGLNIDPYWYYYEYDANFQPTLTNNLGLAIPTGASVSIANLSGNLGNIVVQTGASLSIDTPISLPPYNDVFFNDAASLTNNDGINVPSGATVAIYSLTGNLGSVVQSPNSYLTINDASGGDLVGGSLTNNLGLSVPANSHFDVNGLTGNLGSIAIAGPSTNVTLIGTNLTNDQGLNVPAGDSVTLDGLTGNLGSIALQGSGSALAINRNLSTYESATLTNDQGFVVPAGVILSVTDSPAIWEAFRRSGPGSTLTIDEHTPSFDDAALTNNQGITVGDGAMFSIEYLVGNLAHWSWVPPATCHSTHRRLTRSADQPPGAVGPAGETALINNLGGNLGSIALATGSNVSIDVPPPQTDPQSAYYDAPLTLTNNLGLSVPTGAQDLSVDFLTGNPGNISLAGAGSTLLINPNATDYTGVSLVNSLGLNVPVGATLSVDDLVGNLGSLSLAGAGSSLAINHNTFEGAKVTNNLGITVPAGAIMSVDLLAGNLGSITLGGAGSSLTIDDQTYSGESLTNNLGISVPANASFSVNDLVGNLGQSWCSALVAQFRSIRMSTRMKMAG